MTCARLLPLGALVGALGCATEAPDFQPVGGPDAPLEYAGTYYELRLDGAALGDAKVWSRGVHPALDLDDEGPPWQVHMGIRIRNDGDAPLRLDVGGTELEVQTEGEAGDLFVVQEEAAVEGPVEVPPDTIRRIALYYDLPEGLTEVDEILGLELSWAIAAPDGRITESTPFRRERRPDLDTYYYRPWTYEPWGVDPYQRPFFPYD